MRYLGEEKKGLLLTNLDSRIRLFCIEYTAVIGWPSRCCFRRRVSLWILVIRQAQLQSNVDNCRICAYQPWMRVAAGHQGSMGYAFVLEIWGASMH